MSGDGPYKCVSCNGREFKSREELEKHNQEQHSTSTLWITWAYYYDPPKSFSTKLFKNDDIQRTTTIGYGKLTTAGKYKHEENAKAVLNMNWL